jgi:hypothetical protein
MTRITASATIVLTLTVSSGAWGANSVIVESRTVSSGTQAVPVGVYLSNDFVLGALIVPLEIRTVSGNAFPAGAFAFNVQGRLSTYTPGGFVAKRFYGRPDPMNSCSGMRSQSYTTGDSIPSGFYTSPDAVMWAGVDIPGSIPASILLSAGSDGTPGSGIPSFLFTFDVGCSEGVFEIDTCCTAPANHLLFVEPLMTQIVVPDFIKGVVTVTGCICACDCLGDPVCDGVPDIFDVQTAVEVTFRGGSPAPDPNGLCPLARSDVDCDGAPTVLDVVRIINVVFRNHDPATEYCTPCGP